MARGESPPTRVLTLRDFARSFGTSADDFSLDCEELIGKTDFQYRVLEGEERDQVILEALKRIETDQQRVGAEERKEVWEGGWSENLRAFCSTNYDLSAIVPRFIRPNQVIRLDRQYIMPTLLYIALPLLGLVAHELPELQRYVLFWLDPFLRTLK